MHEGNWGKSPPPTPEVRMLTVYAGTRKQELLLKCDANAHLILWSRTNINRRSELLLCFFVESGLTLMNQDSKLTFQTVNRPVVSELGQAVACVG